MKRIAAFVLVLIVCVGLCVSVALAVCEHGADAYDLVEKKSPTCTEPGVIVTRCRICGDTQTEVISAWGHSEITEPAEPATCAKEGHGPRVICAVCGAVITRGEVIPKLPHTPETVQKGIEPTETEDGWTDKVVCSVCGAVLQERTRIPAKGTPLPAPTVKPTEGPTEKPTEKPAVTPEPTVTPTSIPPSDMPVRTGGGGRSGRSPFSEDFPFRRLRFEHTEKIVPVIAGEKFELQTDELTPVVGQRDEITGEETDSEISIAGQSGIPAMPRTDGQMLLLGDRSIPLEFAGTLTGTPMVLDGSDIELDITTGLGRISVTPQGKCLVIIAPYT